MAVTITISDVKESVIAQSVPDSVLLGYIAATDLANNCLDLNSVDDNIQRSLKLNAVWHLVELSSRASVTSEKSPTGASRNYTQEQGFQSTPYGQILQSLDLNNCMRNALGSPGRSMFFGSTGVNNDFTRRTISD